MYPQIPLGTAIRHRNAFIEIDDTDSYKRCRVKLHAAGIVLRDEMQGSEIKTKRQQVCRAGEFLVAEIDAKLGGFGIVPEGLHGAIVSSHYFLFEIDEMVLDRSFLGYYIQTSAFRDQVEAQGSTNYAAIRPQHVLDYLIPLPPLHEQQRIVARIESLAAKIEEARGIRTESLEGRKSIVGAVSRNLVAAFGNAPKYSIGEISEVRSGIQKSPNRTPLANPVRYLTVAHVQRDHITLDDPRFFEVTPPELERWRLLPGDVLIVEGNGSATQIGRTALFRGELDNCVHQNHVIRVRPDPRRIDSEFLNTYPNSPVGQAEVQARSRSTSGLRTLSVGRIKSLEIPALSLIQQSRFVDELGELRKRADVISRLQAESANEMAAPLPAIIDRAFRGEL